MHRTSGGSSGSDYQWISLTILIRSKTTYIMILRSIALTSIRCECTARSSLDQKTLVIGESRRIWSTAPETHFPHNLFTNVIFVYKEAQGWWASLCRLTAQKNHFKARTASALNTSDGQPHTEATCHARLFQASSLYPCILVICLLRSGLPLIVHAPQTTE
jgi:hypothetical protein